MVPWPWKDMTPTSQHSFGEPSPWKGMTSTSQHSPWGTMTLRSHDHNITTLTLPWPWRPWHRHCCHTVGRIAGWGNWSCRVYSPRNRRWTRRTRWEHIHHRLRRTTSSATRSSHRQTHSGHSTCLYTFAAKCVAFLFWNVNTKLNNFTSFPNFYSQTDIHDFWQNLIANKAKTQTGHVRTPNIAAITPHNDMNVDLDNF